MKQYVENQGIVTLPTELVGECLTYVESMFNRNKRFTGVTEKTILCHSNCRFITKKASIGKKLTTKSAFNS